MGFGVVGGPHGLGALALLAFEGAIDDDIAEEDGEEGKGEGEDDLAGTEVMGVGLGWG